jgi:hypothetical protein
MKRGLGFGACVLAVLALGGGCGEEFTSANAAGAAGAASDGGECTQQCSPSGLECIVAKCRAAECAFEPLANNTPIATQAAGDCRDVVCDGEGGQKPLANLNDVPDDGNDCTIGVCGGGPPGHTPLPIRTPCTGGKCNGDGACVECIEPGDCPGNACREGLCVPITCTDQVLNGNETDKDCGGGECPACADGQSCKIGSDCKSGVCDGTCRGPTCNDGAANGTETDVDCGGTCPACAAGKGCNLSGDCASFVCEAGACAQSTCVDGVKNGSESDVDCGGSCPGCELGKACNGAGDCKAGPCDGGHCAGSCKNGVHNAGESDVDCGGICLLIGQPCSAGQKCGKAADCATGLSCCTTSVLDGSTGNLTTGVCKASCATPI